MDYVEMRCRFSPTAASKGTAAAETLQVPFTAFLEAVMLHRSQQLAADPLIGQTARTIAEDRAARPGPRRRRTKTESVE